MRDDTRRVVLLAVLLVALMVGAACIGAVHLSLRQVLHLVAEPFGIGLPGVVSAQQRAIFWMIRVPRIVFAALVGSALATAGAALQGVFRNPLADPGLIGVSSGASFAAALLIVLWSPAMGHLAMWDGIPLALPLAAFVGGLVTVQVVLHISRFARYATSAAMLLAGIAVNAVAGAGIGFLTVAANDSGLRQLAFWSLGSLSGTTWSTVAIAAPWLILPTIALMRCAQPLNLLLLGELEAAHLGVRVARTQRTVVALTALSVGTAVAFSGVIGFVGLVVPHIVRLVQGPDHRRLLVPSALVGGLLLVGADLLSRTVIAPAEFPIGVVTAIIGAPYLLWLLIRGRWAAV